MDKFNLFLRYEEEREKKKKKKKEAVEEVNEEALERREDGIVDVECDQCSKSSYSPTRTPGMIWGVGYEVRTSGFTLLDMGDRQSFLASVRRAAEFKKSNLFIFLLRNNSLYDDGLDIWILVK